MSRTTAVLLALAVGSPAYAQDVLVLGTPSIWVWDVDIQTVLTADGRLGRVDVFEVAEATPDAADLEGYDAIVTYTEMPYQDPVRVGNLLADFVDRGGGLVVMAHAFSANRAIAGRIVTGNYMPFSVDGADSGKVGPMGMQPVGSVLRPIGPEGVHEIMLNVVRFYGGPGAFHSTGIRVTPGARRIAEWENGDPLAAVKENGSGRVVGLNFFPPSNFFAPQYAPARDNWDAIAYPEGADPFATTNGGQMIASSILWAINTTATCFNTTIIQDYNCNGVDVTYEPDVDPAAPMCDQGQPKPNQDWYFDFTNFGCEYEVSGNDQDGDFLGGQPQQIFPEDLSPFPDFVGPTCDNCPEDWNPDQRDVECDKQGDLCDVCPTLADMGMDFDADEVGDDCDNCPTDPNTDQGDHDYDIVGDACDNCPELYNPGQEDGGDTDVP
ncbi:MAG TPA: thrombospondin type 3 repeat-containing protein, partial [Microthrixaceae bacterium]|nr:thrombospondin type 3 repeat-containing protein [Microthrixaceae bacterium]